MKEKKNNRPSREELLREMNRLRTENRDINSRFQKMAKMFFLQSGYVNWLEKENTRLIDCMNHGAEAMMDYQNSFQN